MPLVMPEYSSVSARLSWLPNGSLPKQRLGAAVLGWMFESRWVLVVSHRVTQQVDWRLNHGSSRLGEYAHVAHPAHASQPGDPPPDKEAPPATPGLDQTGSPWPGRGHPCRPGVIQAGVAGRERSSPSTDHRPTSERQAATADPARPTAPRAVGRQGTCLATSPPDRQARHTPPLASPRISPLPAPQIQGQRASARSTGRDHRVDYGDGQRQSPVGCRTDPRRVPQTRYSPVQTHDSKISAPRPPTATSWADLVYVCA